MCTTGSPSEKFAFTHQHCGSGLSAVSMKALSPQPFDGQPNDSPKYPIAPQYANPTTLSRFIPK
jgi:hypothetical protein